MVAKRERFDIEEFLETKLREIPGVDIAILSMGAFLGWRGWTPITGLINIAKGFAPSPIITGGPVPPYIAWTTPGLITNIIASFLPRPPAGASPAQYEQYAEQLSKAMLGAVEAYALTRPGTVGGILQGIGQIVPG